MFDFNVLRLGALFNFYICFRSRQGEGMQMQGITSKILEYHFLFWPWPLPLVEKKKRKACRNFVQE